MKKIGIVGIVMMMLCTSLAMAGSQITVDFVSDGDSTFTSDVSVDGNFWDWPSEAHPDTTTATVYTGFENNGRVHFQQMVTDFGNGLQWPNGAEHEWSLLENQQLVGDGDTNYQKIFDVWTVHEGWATEYEGVGNFDTLAGDYNYGFGGTTYDSASFNQIISTDLPFESTSWIFVNPFEESQS